ncbi:MAG: phosphoglucosamine mutase [Candidatus Neomarinimicrobiota bacterium]|tara:strand:- start:2091 stop:3428 length:1338 start_codon:yes stop_codon:yes gene_type:complete
MIIRSISGVRGITKTSLTSDLIKLYAHAFHDQIPQGLIYLGRDSRPSGEHILEIFSNELIDLGRDVVNCEVVPTPTVQFMVERSEAVGGVIITASHNPEEWNGMKFVREDGTFFFPEECERLFKKTDTNFVNEKPNKKGMYFPDQNSILKHVVHIIELSCINLKRIKNQKYKVVIDSVNGAGSKALPLLLEYLGCEVISIHCDGSGQFNRGTEPLPENLGDLGKKVLDNNADIGFAVDPDADRLAIVNNFGQPLGEEYTLVLAAEGFLKEVEKGQDIVTNLSTTIALEKMAENNDSKVQRTAVGEINVVKRMIEIGSNIGGEGNGGVILKEAHLGRDSLVGVAMILNRLSQDADKSISEIHNTLPQFNIVKDKVQLDHIDESELIRTAKDVFINSTIDTTDGIKFIWSDKWIHLRKSNTEPIIRIYAEAPTIKDAKILIQKLKSQ